MTGNIYLDLTNEFNDGALRAILSSGQAIVVHGLAFASKDGDWIVRETPESLDHILRVLALHGARYRMGAPLDARWMRGGWSAHFEFNHNGERIRCDFVSRPPRVSAEDLSEMWREHEEGRGLEEPVPTIDVRRLAELKKTDRERDYPFIAELAPKMALHDQILQSRSALDLMELAKEHRAEVVRLAEERSLLRLLLEQVPDRRAIRLALSEEQIDLMDKDAARLADYARAATQWQKIWPELRKQARHLPLIQAHQLVVQHAQSLLPEQPDGTRIS